MLPEKRPVDTVNAPRGAARSARFPPHSADRPPQHQSPKRPCWKRNVLFCQVRRRRQTVGAGGGAKGAAMLRQRDKTLRGGSGAKPRVSKAKQEQKKRQEDLVERMERHAEESLRRSQQRESGAADYRRGAGSPRRVAELGGSSDGNNGQRARLNLQRRADGRAAMVRADAAEAMAAAAKRRADDKAAAAAAAAAKKRADDKATAARQRKKAAARRKREEERLKEEADELQREEQFRLRRQKQLAVGMPHHGRTHLPSVFHVSRGGHV